MAVYLDLVMLLNFLVDYLLLLGTNRLSGSPMTPGRCALAAVLGSVYAGACLLPGFRFLGNSCGGASAWGSWQLLPLGAAGRQ